MTYEVTAEHDGTFWFIRIPELDGARESLAAALSHRLLAATEHDPCLQ